MEATFTAIMDNGGVAIPEPVCRLFGLKDGDVVHFRISRDITTIVEVQEAEDDPFATFSEWNSVDDDELYRHL